MARTEIWKEMEAINNAIIDHLGYCGTVAQLATLALIQEHFVALAELLKK